MMGMRQFWLWMVLGALAAGVAGCDDDDDGDGDGDGPEETGESCEVADECFEDIDRDSLEGDVVCMDRVEGGYCTHHCADDLDCCAVDGECESGFPQVCGPFESTGQMFCFLSCEGVDDENYCQLNAHPSFICRSTGGGSENRKVCVPGG